MNMRDGHLGGRHEIGSGEGWAGRCGWGGFVRDGSTSCGLVVSQLPFKPNFSFATSALHCCTHDKFPKTKLQNEPAADTNTQH